MGRGDVYAVWDENGAFCGFSSEDGAVSFSRSNQVDRLIERHRIKHQKGVSRANAVGDSYALGIQASVPAKSLYGLLKAALGTDLAFANYGFNGMPMVAYLRGSLSDGAGAASMSVYQTLKDDVFFSMMGLNDARGASTGCGTSPANMAQMQAKAQAVATWMLVPESAKVRMHTANNSGPNPAVTFNAAGGAWSHGGLGGDPNCSYSNAAGASATFQTPAGNLLIVWTSIDSGSTNPCTVTVDGTQVATWSTTAQYDNWQTSCLIVPLPSSGTHTVVLAQSGAGNMAVSAAACVDTSSDFGASLLYCPGVHLNDAANAGWSDPGGTLNGATAQALGAAGPYVLNNAGSDRFASALIHAMDQLFALGFNVAYVPARVGFVPAAHIGADKVHPSDLGYEHLHRPFLAVMKRMAGK